MNRSVTISGADCPAPLIEIADMKGIQHTNTKDASSNRFLLPLVGTISDVELDMVRT